MRYTCEADCATVRRSGHSQLANSSASKQHTPWCWEGLYAAAWHTNKEIKQARASKVSGDIGPYNALKWAWKITNRKILDIAKTPSMSAYISRQNERWVAHLVRAGNDDISKQLMFMDKKYKKGGNRVKMLYELVISRQDSSGKSADTFHKECVSKNLLTAQTR